MRFPTISKAPEQSAHMHSLIRAFASRLNILWVLSYWLNLWAYKEAAQARLSLHSSECHTLSRINLWYIGFDRCIRYAGYFHISKKRKNSDKYHKSSFSCKQCAVHARVHCNCFFFLMQTHEKETQLGNYVWCAKSVFVRQFPPRATRVLKQQQHVVW